MATYGDKLDYLQLGAEGVMIGAMAEETQTHRTATLRGLVNPFPMDVITQVFNPTTATLRKAIIAAYDAKAKTIDTGKVKAAYDAAIQTLETEMASRGVDALKKREGKLAYHMLVALAAADTLAEEVPERGRQHGG